MYKDTQGVIPVEIMVRLDQTLECRKENKQTKTLVV
jgi:hypothetical protein